MTYEQFASELPADRTMTFRSAEELEVTMLRLGVEQPLRQLGRGAFRCDIAAAETDEGMLFSDRFNKAFAAHLQPPPGSVGFLFCLSAGGEMRALGGEVANDRLVLFPEGSGAEIVSEDMGGSIAVALPTDRFLELTETLCPGATSARLNQVAAIDGDRSRLHALRTALGRVMAEPQGKLPRVNVANLFASTIAWAAHASNDQEHDRVRSGNARTRIASRTRDFIEEHYREPLRLGDICRNAGVGVRTLQRCFRENFNVTVWDYVKAVRFDAARRELRSAHGDQASIADIAVRNGHAHLGRFSVEYRERFGESPKATLARPLSWHAASRRGWE